MAKFRRFKPITQEDCAGLGMVVIRGEYYVTYRRTVGGVRVYATFEPGGCVVAIGNHLLENIRTPVQLRRLLDCLEGTAE